MAPQDRPFTWSQTAAAPVEATTMNWEHIVQSMRRLGSRHRLSDRFAARTRALLDGSRPEENDTQATSDAVASAIAIAAASARDGPTSPPEP